MTRSGATERRLFFALWPGPETRRELVGRKAMLEPRVQPAGRRLRPVPDRNLHLTLVFLGNVAADRVDGLVDAAGRLQCLAFTIVLDRFGTFPAARVAWLGGGAPSAGQALVEALAAVAEACGIGVERRAWRPHVTLFRQVQGLGGAAAKPPVLRWSAREFALVESIPSQPYQVLRSWPLQCEAIPGESSPDA